MQYRYLGNTGLQISEYSFGTMTFGRETEEAEARRLVDRAMDAGINCFDCADLYAGGIAETILGKALKGKRDQVLVISKAYFPTGPNVNDAGLSRHHLIRAVEDSLTRLGTDYLDMFFMHRFDDRTGLEETLRALDDLIRAGKIRTLGASNFAAWQVARALGHQEKNGWTRLSSIQPMYNLIKRQAEVELLPLAIAENLAVLAYSPLAAGMLTGKYRGGRRPEAGRLVTNALYRTRYGEEWMFDAAEQFVALAEEAALDPIALAIAWVHAHPAVTSIILGARDIGQLEEVLAASTLTLTADMYDRVSSISRTPPPATDRTEEWGVNSYPLR